MTPTSRTLNKLRADGWDVVEVVERWIPKVNIRRDFIGIGDVLAVNPDRLLLVQCTSDANVAARVNKARSEARLKVWLSSPHRSFEVWGWDGKRCRVVPVVLDDVQDVVAVMPKRRKPRPRERGLFDLGPMERAAAKERQAATQGNKQTGEEKFSQPEKGKATDRVAAAVGMEVTI